MGPFIGMLPFAAARRLTVEHMAGSRSRIVMPLGDGNAALDGSVHEGALLALLDTTGAMASWAATGPGRYKASTAALQAQVTGAPPAGTLVGYGRVVQRSGDLFWSDVEIAEVVSGRLRARGTVVYRIVT
jgi:acyl-coenzyme A thioesterase PaaI-like protein